MSEEFGSDGAPISSSAMPQSEKSDYAFAVEGAPDFSMLTIDLPAGKSIRVEASAMASMDTNIRMQTKMKGGLGRLLTGESLFVNEFSAQEGAGKISIAPGPPGDLGHVYLSNQTIYLQNSAFVASGMDVKTESKWQGLTKGFFSGESLFLVRCSGTGDLWFNTFGSMIELEAGRDQYVIDTGHIVAFTDGLEYDVRRVGGYKSLFFSGEGLVCRFRGSGKIWVQTRAVGPFSSWIHWYRPQKNRN